MNQEAGSASGPHGLHPGGLLAEPAARGGGGQGLQGWIKENRIQAIKNAAGWNC